MVYYLVQCAYIHVQKTIMCCTGSTALVAVVRGTKLTVANVGDSRGVLCDMDGKSHPLSFDHKPHEVVLSISFLPARR